MLAVFHRIKANFGADSRYTGCVDHHIYESSLNQHTRRGYGYSATFDNGINVFAGRSVGTMADDAMCDGDGLMGPRRVDVGDCGNLNPIHH